jgi:hypothetical protein
MKVGRHLQPSRGKHFGENTVGKRHSNPSPQSSCRTVSSAPLLRQPTASRSRRIQRLPAHRDTSRRQHPPFGRAAFLGPASPCSSAPSVPPLRRSWVRSLRRAGRVARLAGGRVFRDSGASRTLGASRRRAVGLAVAVALVAMITPGLWSWYGSLGDRSNPIGDLPRRCFPSFATVNSPALTRRLRDAHRSTHEGNWRQGIRRQSKGDHPSPVRPGLAPVGESPSPTGSPTVTGDHRPPSIRPIPRSGTPLGVQPLVWGV